MSDQHPRPEDHHPVDPAHPAGADHPTGADHGRTGPVLPPPPPSYDDTVPLGATAPAPSGLGAPAPSPAPRRGRLVAGVATLALLVGGGAGLGGAALQDALDDDAPTTGAGVPASAGTSASAPAPVAVADGTIEAVAEEVLPSVVKIDVRGEEGAGSGSGIVLSEDGQILTNQHVIEVAEDGGTIRVGFTDGTTAEAEVLGSDPLTDTAVIQAVDVSGLTPIEVGDSDALRVGQQVVAVGSPFGLDSTVTTGIVSALDRPVNVGRTDEGGTTTYPAIQTDAAINPGNSGGPLVDTEGRLVGINSSIRTAATGTGQAGSIGLGFAIPIDEVLPIVEQMAAGEEPTHARLGVSITDVATAQVPGALPEGLVVDADELPAAGALVSEVPAGAAADAGLQPGDVVVRVDDTVITGSDSLIATIRSYRPGDEVEVTWVRDGEEQSATLELGSDADGS
ncbi:S1C family serine protease [Nocardioides perillae]|uniref:Putative serine protease PepD n=1 Tax=Nocardioides perillae TaxID=1119534 RepID=A0A7Y9UNW9_9ACTN|nr:trypsin-like peptidase domain-containing protein [Nocardioides perillae]NYG56921.1 putative serine protease PepD [Nocardioides perillae]